MTDEKVEDTPKASAKLTRRRRRWADEYLTGVTGAEACRRIGMEGTPQHLADRASRIKRRPEVKAYLEERRKDLSEATQIRAEQIARELSFIAFGSLKNLFDADGNIISVRNLSDEQAAMLSGIDVEAKFEGRGESRVPVGNVLKVRTFNKIDALEKLAKLLGLLKDKVELDMINTPPPVINISTYPDADEAEREARAAFSRNSTAT